jgi:DNA (cytosine-5)-methyltransferase 1
VRFGSVCSGIEAASVAWRPLGWRAAFVSEIDAFPCAVLAHHHPEAPNFGDMTRFADWPDATIDLLVGGTPCQSFSVAGLRKGLADPRGNLMLTYGAIAAKYRPRWLVWENVPGVLSSNGGRDFGAFLGMLAELGYGFAYRVLDAQYFGLAQRRKRVFVVGCLGDWRRAAAVLSERSSLRGDPAPSRKAWKGTAGSIESSLGRSIAGCINSAGGNAVPGNSVQDADQGYLIPVAHALRADGFDAGEDGTGRGTRLVPVAFDARQSDVIQYGDKSGPLDTDGHTIGVHAGMAVRRLTPRECERLQGFPDDYTLIQYRGKPAADGLRYKALGNSMAVPVMAWIGRRIQMVEDLTNEARAA